MNISLTRLPWYAQVGAFVALAAAGISSYYQYYEVPFVADLEAQRAELKAIRGDIDKAAATARKLDEFRGVVDGLESRLSSLREVLPEAKDAADLLRRMQTVAEECHLRIKSFKPAPAVTKQIHAEWPISLELDGTYHDLATFFDRVGKFARIVNITSLDVKGSEKADAGATVVATCVATTFVLIEKPAAAQKPEPAGPVAATKPAD